MKPIDPNEE